MGPLTKSLCFTGFQVSEEEIPLPCPRGNWWPMSDDQWGFFCFEERFGAKFVSFGAIPGSPLAPSTSLLLLLVNVPLLLDDVGLKIVAF